MYLRAQKKLIDEMKAPNKNAPGPAIINSKDLSNWLKANGGVTDGGGNLVQGQLYDYWLKSGTQVINLNELLRWNSELETMLNFIKEFSPKAANFGYKGWYEQIIAAAMKQEWVIDSKPIVNSNCWNLSSNVSAYQEVVACNTAHSVHFDGYKFLEELKDDEKAQAGLIMHELLLSWAKENFGILMSKYALEEAVREINVAVRDQNKVQEVMRRFIPKSMILTTQEIAQLNHIQSSLFFSGTLLCKGNNIDNAEYYKLASMSPVVRAFLGNDLNQLITLLNSIGTDNEGLARIKFCYDMRLITPTSNDKISMKCRKNIDISIDNVFTTESKVDIPSFEKIKANWSTKLATACYEDEKFRPVVEREEIFLQALDYFKKSLKRYDYFFSQPSFILSPFNG